MMSLSLGPQAPRGGPLPFSPWTRGDLGDSREFAQHYRTDIDSEGFVKLPLSKSME